MSLINNGLPKGLFFKDIRVGDILEIEWDDGPNEKVVVLHSSDLGRQKTYRGHVSIYIMRIGEGHNSHVHSIEGDQVVRRTGENVLDILRK